MRTVGVDATALTGQRTGVGNYIWPLLAGMAGDHPETTFLLYSNDDIDAPEQPNIRCRVSRPKRRGPYWQNTHFAQMLRADRPEVLWASNGLAPAARPRTTALVVTVHDLVYRHAANTLPRHSYLGRALFQPLAVRAADRVVAVSEATAADLRRACGRDADAVIHPLAAAGYDLSARNDAERVRSGYHLPPRFMLVAGTLEPRKNLACLMQAYLDCREVGLDLPALVIAGRKGWRDAGIERSAAAAERQGWVRRLGYVPDDDMPGLYAAADVFVLPSRYEGFGLPLVEAQLCGTPVMHGPHASMAEASGGAGIALQGDVAGLAADLARYARGTVGLRCRVPASIDNDAHAGAQQMWRVLSDAVRR